MIRKYLIVFLTVYLSACSSDRQKKEFHYSDEICSQSQNDSTQILKGILNINSKGKLVFNDIKTQKEWHRKIHLIPCSEYLQNYTANGYDSHLYLRNSEEAFWVSVEGKYITSDTLDSPPDFLFNSISLIDEIEAKTDSSNAFREKIRE